MPDANLLCGQGECQGCTKASGEKAAGEMGCRKGTEVGGLKSEVGACPRKDQVPNTKFQGSTNEPGGPRTEDGAHTFRIALERIVSRRAGEMVNRIMLDACGLFSAWAVERGRSEAELMLAKVLGRITAVGEGLKELRQENDELRQLHAGGFLQFALQVERDDFLAFVTILALGNRKKAAAFLEVPERSFYEQVARWESKKDKAYTRMARAVEWRKKVGRRITLRLGDSLQSGEPGETPENPETVQATLDKIRENEVDSRDYPALLGDILQTLERQNARNWPAVQSELIEIIKEELPP
jgi:hypothetical protein